MGVEARLFLIIVLIGNILDKYFAIFIQTFHLVQVYISAYMEQYSHHRHVISWGQFTIYTLPGRMEEEKEEGGGGQDNLSMYVTYSTLFTISCPYSVLCLTLDSLPIFLLSKQIRNVEIPSFRMEFKVLLGFHPGLFLLLQRFLNRFQH